MYILLYVTKLHDVHVCLYWRCAADLSSQDTAYGQQRLRHYDVINNVTTRKQVDEHGDDYTDDAVDTSG